MLALPEVEKRNNCLSPADQVDIWENLILMCQTLFSRQEINATAPAAAAAEAAAMETQEHCLCVYTNIKGLYNHSGLKIACL